jgi:hypothetical protein
VRLRSWRWSYGPGRCVDLEGDPQRLRERTALRSRVLRDGVAVEIDSTAVVPGDAVLLAAGSLIPAVTIYPASGIEPTVPDG